MDLKNKINLALPESLSKMKKRNDIMMKLKRNLNTEAAVGMCEFQKETKID